MKQSFNTSKLYYGFPIFILGYQDQNFGHNITTCSSSYSLGDWLVIGVVVRKMRLTRLSIINSSLSTSLTKTSCLRWSRLALSAIGRN